MIFSRSGKLVLATGLGVLLLGATSARAVVIAEKTDAQKHRKDIAKQAGKMVLCMAKAAIKCEAEGVVADPECNLENPGASTVPDPKGKIIPKLTAALSKCESKLDLGKKGSGNAVADYQAIGCPGDAIDGGADDPYANLTAYEAGVGPGARTQLGALVPTIAAACDDGDANPDEPEELECGIGQASALLAYAKGVYKCLEKCENDYKNLKGNGGPTDMGVVCNPATSADSNFQACEDAALLKAQKKVTILPATLSAVRLALTVANNDLYNQCDCGAGVGPCP